MNRYIYIFYNKVYNKVYTTASTLAMCITCWVIAGVAESPNHYGWGGHFFDPKSHQCIWNRTSARSYTLFVVFGLIGVPLIVLTYFNIAILWKVYTTQKSVKTNTK